MTNLTASNARLCTLDNLADLCGAPMSPRLAIGVASKCMSDHWGLALQLGMTILTVRS